MNRPPRDGRRAPRRLTAEDRAVWEIIARQVRPLGPGGRRVPEAAAGPEPGQADAPTPDGFAEGGSSRMTVSADALFAETRAAAREDAARVVLRPAPPGGPRVAFELHDPAPGPVGRPEAGLDRRTAERLRRGERAPDARIDLHGMTAERAHRALDRFIADAAARGLRCVLVITGKGGRKQSDDEWFMRPDRGVLRQDAPRWLRAGPAAPEIVGIYAAHRRHGGEGAFYVYLKKRR